MPTVPSVKNPANIHAWCMFGYRALSQLQVVTQETTINGQYYRDNIMANDCLETLNRGAGGVGFQARPMSDPNQTLFMQDGAPPHSANTTQE